MIKYFTLLILSLAVFAQTDILVNMEPGLQKDVFFNMADQTSNAADAVNWDLAFETANATAGVRINNAAGVLAYAVAENAIENFDQVFMEADVDSWTQLRNSHISWSLGALNQQIDTSNPFHYGWGVYDVQTHNVTGNNFYVIQTSIGSWKKIAIDVLIGATYEYQIRIANLDNTDETTFTVQRSDDEGRNFIYYSVDNATIVQREPVSTDWNLAFTQYETLIPTGPNPEDILAYTVAGVLTNKGVTVAQLEGADYNTVDESTAANAEYSADIDVIGYDWKEFDQMVGQYIYPEGRVYLVQLENFDVYKLAFYSYGGAGDGQISFTQEFVTNITGVGIFDINVPALEVYPNPTNGLVHIPMNGQHLEIEIFNAMGQNIVSQALSTSTINLNELNLNSGLYILQATEKGQVIGRSSIILQ